MWSTLDVKNVQRKLKTSINVGLTEEEAENRKKQYGENKLDEGKKESLFIKFIKQFNDFMIIILIIAAVILLLYLLLLEFQQACHIFKKLMIT